jgi:hypothetical protein
MTHPAIISAIEYLEARGTKIPVEVILQLYKLGYVVNQEDKKGIADLIKSNKIHSKEIKQAMFYQPIRDELWAVVYDAVYNYLSSHARSENVPPEARTMAAAIGKAYIETTDIAYVDGGGSLPLDGDTLSLARSYMNQQLAFVDGLFETLKQMRKEGDFDAISVAFQKANSWSDSLDGFYNMVKLAGAGNKMLTFVQVRNTKESCDDCVRLRGKRHRASWWISHEYVPPKGIGLACSAGGHCGDALIDDNGNEFTI